MSRPGKTVYAGFARNVSEALGRFAKTSCIVDETGGAGGVEKANRGEKSRCKKGLERSS